MFLFYEGDVRRIGGAIYLGHSAALEGFGRRGWRYVKGSGELGATAVIDGKGIDAIAKLSVVTIRELNE